MEQGPEEMKITMNYGEALDLAKENMAQFEKNEILVIESHLMEKSINLSGSKREEFEDALRKLEDTPNNLIKLGIEYGLYNLKSSELEQRALEIFCDRNNIEII